MKIKMGAGEVCFKICNGLIMTFVALITLYPMLYVLFSSLSDSAALMTNDGFLLWPQGFTLEAFAAVFQHPMVLTGFKNSFFIVATSLVISILLTAFGAYSLMQKHVPGMKLAMKLIMVTMFINGGLIPFFLIVQRIGLMGTQWSVILPFAINTFNLIIMKTSFEGIPDSLIESARIDGANDFRILFQIVMPVAKATIAVMILYYGVAQWNSWMYPSIFITDKQLQPIQVFLRDILIDNDSSLAGNAGVDKVAISETIKYATVVVSTIPILMIYPFLQKYFVQGVMIGAVKG